MTSGALELRPCPSVASLRSEWGTERCCWGARPRPQPRSWSRSRPCPESGAAGLRPREDHHLTRLHCDPSRHASEPEALLPVGVPSLLATTGVSPQGQVGCSCLWTTGAVQMQAQGCPSPGASWFDTCRTPSTWGSRGRVTAPTGQRHAQGPQPGGPDSGNREGPQAGPWMPSCPRRPGWANSHGGKPHTQPPVPCPPAPQQADRNSAKGFLHKPHTPSRLLSFSWKRPVHP